MNIEKMHENVGILRDEAAEQPMQPQLGTTRGFMWVSTLTFPRINRRGLIEGTYVQRTVQPSIVQEPIVQEPRAVKSPNLSKALNLIDRTITKIMMTYKEDKVDLYINRLFKILYRTRALSADEQLAVHNHMGSFFMNAYSTATNRELLLTIVHIENAYNRERQRTTPCAVHMHKN